MAEKKEVVRIDPWSLGKIEAVFGLIAGLIAGILGAISFLISSGTPQMAAFANFGTGFFAGVGILIIIVAPIVFALIGLIAGIIMALVYNFIVKYVGGVELEFK